MVELSLEFKVGLGLEDDLLQGFLQGLDSGLCVLAQLCDSLVLPLTVEALLLRLVHLRSTADVTDDRQQSYSLTHTPFCLTVHLTDRRSDFQHFQLTR